MTRPLQSQAPAPSPPTSTKIPWLRTLLLESPALSTAASCRIFLKLESTQPSGSFKIRGVGNFVRANVRLDDPSTPTHFYISSGGNAGLAAVTAARSLQQLCTVVVPTSTKLAMIAKLRAIGATDVIQKGANWAEADRYLREQCLARDERNVYVPPFDHELVWEGNGTLVTEVREQMEEMGVGEPDAIVCSVGGGGLFAGIVQGVEREFDGRSQVIAVETVGCDSLNQSLKKGESVTLPEITSLATSLGAVRVAERAFELAQRENVTSVTVSDAEAAAGCWRFADDERGLVEMSCGATMVLAYNGMLKRLVSGFSKESKVVLVVCGGSNVSLDMLKEYRETFGEEAERSLAANSKVPSEHTAPA